MYVISVYDQVNELCQYLHICRHCSYSEIRFYFMHNLSFCHEAKRKTKDKGTGSNVYLQSRNNDRNKSISFFAVTVSKDDKILVLHAQKYCRVTVLLAQLINRRTASTMTPAFPRRVPVIVVEVHCRKKAKNAFSMIQVPYVRKRRNL